MTTLSYHCSYARSTSNGTQVTENLLKGKTAENLRKEGRREGGRRERGKERKEGRDLFPLRDLDQCLIASKDQMRSFPQRQTVAIFMKSFALRNPKIWILQTFSLFSFFFICKIIFSMK